jgi:hypothetical protein
MRSVYLVLFSLALACAQAQQTPQTPGAAAAKAPHGAPSPEQLEPAVDTTATAPGAMAAPPGAAPVSGVVPKSDGSRAADGAPGGGAAAATRSGGSSRNAARGPKGPDRVELETTEITGNRELPKVLYIVPWKRSDLGDLVGRPANSLLDEVLQPIDREVFLRENRYYDAVKPDAAAARPGTVPPSGKQP